MNKTTLPSGGEGENGALDSDNPFVGLRPFEAGESFLFFGRNKQTTEILQKLHTTRFIGVVGSSGCGKSSLIKAGVIPLLSAGFLTEERSNWIISSMRPGGHPLQYLAEAYNEAVQHASLPEDHPSRQRKISYEDIREKSISELLDHFYPVLEETRCNLLLLVDQFEELFTSRRKDVKEEEQKNENIFFVNLLLSMAKQRNLPIYIIITMRSDYIGQCNQFYELPEVLNEGQYLVPRLNRQQLREVIEFPIRLYGQKISSRLLDLLLNDCDKDLDQLPVLQHCLMRTYKFWLDSGENRPVDFEDYEKAGRLDNAISKHANEIYLPLTDRQKQIAQCVFRTITDVNADNDPIRRRQTFADLVEVCKTVDHVTEAEVLAVIDKFRNPSCAFLIPFTAPVQSQTFIDITHESLMRQWDELKKWMKDEQDSGRKYKWLSDSVNRELLRGIDLNDAIEWREKQRPNAAWAARYAKNRDQGIFFEVENYIEKSLKQMRRNRIIRSVIVSSFLGLIGAVIAILVLGQHSRVLAKEKEFKMQYDAKLNDSLKRVAENTLVKEVALRKAITDSAAATEEKRKEIEKQAEMLTALNKMKDEIADDLEAKTNHLTAQTDTLAKQVNIAELQQWEFYKRLDPDLGEKAVRFLLPYYKKDERKAEFRNAVSAINSAIIIKNAMQAAPVETLKLAKKYSSSLTNQVAKDIVVRAINKNLFYKQKMSGPGDFSMASVLTLSDDRRRISFNLDNGIKTLLYEKDSLWEESLFRNIRHAGDTQAAGSASGLSFVSIAYTPSGVTGMFEDGYAISVRQNQTSPIAKVPDVQEAVFSAVSGNGRYVITASAEGGPARLWDLEALSQNKNTRPLYEDAGDRIWSQVRFSPSNDRAVLLDSEGRAEIWDVQTKEAIRLKQPGEISTAAFSPDGKYILTTSRHLRDTVIVKIWDLKGSELATEYIQKEEGYRYKDELDTYLDYNKEENDVSSISLSPNARRIIVQRKGDISLFEKEDGSPIFSLDEKGKSVKAKDKPKQNSKYLVKHFAGNQTTGNVQTAFLNDSAIISVGEYGDVYLWKIHPMFSSLDDALGLVEAVPLTFEERLERGTISFDEIMASTSREDLQMAASHFSTEGDNAAVEELRKEKYTQAKKLYWRLMELETDSAKKAGYENDIAFLNDGLYTIDNNAIAKLSAGEKLKKAPQLVALLKENADLRERLWRKTSDAFTKEDLCSNYWNLSWFQLWTGDFDGAVKSADRGIRLYGKDNYGIITNLALGYVLGRHYPEAEALYRKYKDSVFVDDTQRKFKDAFLGDFTDLEAMGIISKSATELYGNVQKIKAILGGK